MADSPKIPPKLLNKVYRLLAIRQRSEKEIRTYVKNKVKEQISEDVLESLINNLKQISLIDDAEFAKAWIDSRRRFRQKGKQVLKYELLQKGIAKEIIEELLSSLNSDSEKELAKQALEKKSQNWTSLTYLEKKKKAYQFLMQKGFEYEIVAEVIEKILKKR